MQTKKVGFANQFIITSAGKMENLAKKRRERGEVTQTDINPFLLMPTDELLDKLLSPTPTIRTCAATVLSNHKESIVVDALCKQIKIEKKLYCKIAISDSLVKIGSLSIAPLLALLGKIGKNQEREIPQKGFNKISYPLPRDIAARILCRMNENIVTQLIEFIKSDREPIEIEQAIDVIGHIVYTKNRKLDSRILLRISKKHKESPMIQFKITRCFSGFSDNFVKHFLYDRLRSSDPGLQLEAARSLVLSGLNLPAKDYKINEDVLKFTKQLTKKING